MSRWGVRAGVSIVVAVLIAASGFLSAQVKEYDWYPDFRVWVQTNVPIGQRSPAALAERYAEKLKAEGVSAEEIRRRLTLLQTRRQELENDFWNRFFTIDKPSFNTEPNAFLASVVASRKPGRCSTRCASSTTRIVWPRRISSIAARCRWCGWWLRNRKSPEGSPRGPGSQMMRSQCRLCPMLRIVSPSLPRTVSALRTRSPRR